VENTGEREGEGANSDGSKQDADGTWFEGHARTGFGAGDPGSGIARSNAAVLPDGSPSYAYPTQIPPGTI